MVSTFTNGKMHLEKPAAGDYVDAWAPPINANFDAADAAVSNASAITITSADVTLTQPQARTLLINCTGALTGNRQLIFPNTADGLVGGVWIINNQCTGTFTLTAIVRSGAGIQIPATKKVVVVSDGTNLILASDALAGSLLSVTANPTGSPSNLGDVANPYTSFRYDNVAQRLYAGLGGTAWIAIAAALPLLVGDIGAGAVTNPKLTFPRMTAQWLTGVGAAQTYNRPTDCHTILIIEIGSGGGGGSASNTQNGADGGDTTFNSIVAKGGSGGQGGNAGLQGYGGPGGQGGAGAALLRIAGSSGVFGFQSNNNFQSGGVGAPGLFGMGGGNGGRNNGAGGAAAAGSGAGGGAGSGAQNSAFAGGGGGSGELVFILIQNPAATYTYTITNGGAGGVPGSQAGGAGGSGSILVLEFY